MRRTEGKPTTFWIRLENFPWEYWERTRVLSWGVVRGFVGFWIGGVLGFWMVLGFKVSVE